MLVSLVKRAFGLRTAANRFVEGMLAYERGAYEEALRLFEGALKTDSSKPEGFLYAGLAAYCLARYAEALAHFERAIALDPADTEYRYRAGAAESMLGNHDKAWRRCEEVLERDPDFAGAHFLMSQIALPGPMYLAMLSAIQQTLRPRTYVEIGVFRGRSIRLARPETRADRHRSRARDLGAFAAEHDRVRA